MTRRILFQSVLSTITSSSEVLGLGLGSVSCMVNQGVEALAYSLSSEGTLDFEPTTILWSNSPDSIDCGACLFRIHNMIIHTCTLMSRGQKESPGQTGCPGRALRFWRWILEVQGRYQLVGLVQHDAPVGVVEFHGSIPGMDTFDAG